MKDKNQYRSGPVELISVSSRDIASVAELGVPQLVEGSLAMAARQQETEGRSAPSFLI